MAAPNALHDLAYDSGSCAGVVIGTTVCTFTKVALPKSEVKVSKISPVGAGRDTRRTAGKLSIADMMTEMLVTDYAPILNAQNVHGGTEIQHVIIARLAHPGILGSFGTLLDGARIISLEGPDLDGSEKEAIIKLGWSIMNRRDRIGTTRTWKCLGFENTLPSAQAQALMDL